MATWWWRIYKQWKGEWGSWLGPSVAGLLVQTPSLDSKSVRLELDKVALRQFFFLQYVVFSCHYHFTNAPYSFIHVLPTPHNFSKLQCQIAGFVCALEFLMCVEETIAGLWKVTGRFVMSVCLSVRIEQLGSHWTDFVESGISEFFEYLSEISNFIKIWQE